MLHKMGKLRNGWQIHTAFWEKKLLDFFKKKLSWLNFCRPIEIQLHPALKMSNLSIKSLIVLLTCFCRFTKDNMVKSNIDKKFSAHYDAVEAELKSSTVGESSASLVAHRRTEFLLVVCWRDASPCAHQVWWPSMTWRPSRRLWWRSARSSWPRRSSPRSSSCEAPHKSFDWSRLALCDSFCVLTAGCFVFAGSWRSRRRKREKRSRRGKLPVCLSTPTTKARRRRKRRKRTTSWTVS